MMAPEGALNIIYPRELPAAEDPEAALRAKVEEFRERFANPFIAAENGFLDDVIEPRQTRPYVIRALRMLETKVDTTPRKKHGNIPL
jgi:propionyl-CoA carboxylase beta chain